MVVIAFVQVVVPFLLITYGENHISSSLTSILISSVPIFTALLALRFDHAERSQGWALVGIVIGIVGVALLFGLDLSGSADELAGGAMMVAAAFCYAISWMLVKHKMAGAAPEAVAGGTLVIRRRRPPRCSSPRRRPAACRSTASRRCSRSARAGPGSRSSSTTRSSPTSAPRGRRWSATSRPPSRSSTAWSCSARA